MQPMRPAIQSFAPLLTVSSPSPFIFSYLRPRFVDVTRDMLTPSLVPTSLQPSFTPAEIGAHLDRVLASEPFRNSRRSQEFLRFVVNQVLEGREESIKERNIAVEVFQRGLGYNSSEDSFVRVKAGEVRRRLAAYYATEHAEDHLRFELPVGNYVPHFVRLEAAAAPRETADAAAAVASRRRPRWPWISAALCATIAAAASLTLLPRRQSALEQFWAPILRSPEPVVIFLPIPASYSAIGEAEARRQTDPVWQGVGPAGELRFFASAPHKVGVGAAVGAIRFAVLCAQTGKPYTLKSGTDFSFADLRNQPAVLFGAFSSPWAVEINNEYRFKLIGGPGQNILDSLNPSRQWRATPGRYPGTPSEDYALASRVIDSKSGRTVIIAAGISTYGTQAAAEFLTEPSRLEELSRRARRPLSQGNFQVLLYTKVIGNSPTPARIIDAHFW